jgi:hypothetical protein
MHDPNLAMLELVARGLGPLCDDVVFVGGCATGLLLTQARADSIRITEDVDIVAETLSVQAYHAIEARLRARGFCNDMRPYAPVCRWVYKSVTLDLMPTEKSILGFANRWYPLVITTAQPVTLPSGRIIKLVTPPVFIATKIEAFKDRGKNSAGNPDFLGSHDMEDIITVVDRRTELMAECRAMSAEFREYLAQEFRAMFANRDFEVSIAGHLPGDAASQSRLGKLKESLRNFTSL